jgi:hypothetical protein
MKNIKDAIKALKIIKDESQMQLIAVGSQFEEGWEQETAVDQEHYVTRKDNYVLNIDGNQYLFNIERNTMSNRYTAQEDEWIDETTLEKDIVSYNIAPLYFEEYIDNYYNAVSRCGESYSHNKLSGDSDVPDYILNFANQLTELEKNIQNKKRYELSIDDFEDEDEYYEYEERIDRERYHEDIMMAECEAERTPADFYPTYKEPLTIEGDTLLNIQFGLDEQFEKAGKVSEYLRDRIEEAHVKNFKKSDLETKIEELGFKFNELKDLNMIANKSGKPTAFLNKLDKYSNTEAIEMYHMMTQSDKVIEIFSKDLDQYDIKQNEDLKIKRNRGNRPR